MELEQFCPLLIENDNLLLVWELKANGRSKSQVADIVQDIRNSTQLLTEAIFLKINRTANDAADGLARLDHDGLSVCVMLGRVPPCVLEWMIALIGDLRNSTIFSHQLLVLIARPEVMHHLHICSLLSCVLF